MRKTITWILVADGARARIFANAGPGKGLQPAIDQDFAAELHPSREIVSDRPGRVKESASSTRHAMEARVDWHRFEKEKFAKSMAKLLDEAAERGAFGRLVLVAPPRTLGDLRGALNARTRALVAGEIDKDLTHVTPQELPDHLYKVLAL